LLSARVSARDQRCALSCLDMPKKAQKNTMRTQLNLFRLKRRTAIRTERSNDQMTTEREPAQPAQIHNPFQQRVDSVSSDGSAIRTLHNGNKGITPYIKKTQIFWVTDFPTFAICRRPKTPPLFWPAINDLNLPSRCRSFKTPLFTQNISH
jgi:hypothetical protein